MEYGKKTENHWISEKHLDDLKNDEITEKHEKWEMHTVGPGIWQENWKSQKMGITLFT